MSAVEDVDDAGKNFQTLTGMRNVAIVAHVDHGKTTLVDALLKECSVFRENEETVQCVMDNNPQERERGITILARESGA